MRILITGGAGFIAYHLASRLQDEGYEVNLLDNFNTFYDPALKRKNVRDLQSRGPVRLFETDILDVAGSASGVPGDTAGRNRTSCRLGRRPSIAGESQDLLRCQRYRNGQPPPAGA